MHYLRALIFILYALAALTVALMLTFIGVSVYMLIFPPPIL